MEYLKEFFVNVFDEEQEIESKNGSFSDLTEEEIEAHFNVSKYGDFELTEAIRPSFDLKVVPAQGYRHDTYQDEENGATVPVLMVSATKEILFDLFIELLEPLGGEVDVVLETSHSRDDKGHKDLYREHIDLPVLRSVLYEYEDLLLNDGCTGIAVLNSGVPQEIQFDEHKLLIIYGQPLAAFEQILERRGVPCCEDMKFITEAEHVHSSNDQYASKFEELKTRLGMDGVYDGGFQEGFQETL